MEFGEDEQFRSIPIVLFFLFFLFSSFFPFHAALLIASIFISTHLFVSGMHRRLAYNFSEFGLVLSGRMLEGIWDSQQILGLSAPLISVDLYNVYNVYNRDTLTFFRYW